MKHSFVRGIRPGKASFTSAQITLRIEQASSRYKRIFQATLPICPLSLKLFTLGRRRHRQIFFHYLFFSRNHLIIFSSTLFQHFRIRESQIHTNTNEEYVYIGIHFASLSKRVVIRAFLSVIVFGDDNLP